MNGRLRRILFENFALKVISLALAVLLYVLLRSVQAHNVDGAQQGARAQYPANGISHPEQPRPPLRGN